MNLKILLIDDSESDRFLFRGYLRKPGHKITTLEASNAEEVIEHIRNNDDIDYIFMDYMMPDIDGISLLKKIYDKQSQLAPFPTVMLTGMGSESVAIDAIRHGAQDYLIKEIANTDTLYISMAKAKEVFDLKKSHNEARSLLEHTQKLDAIGKLTGGIAHDFNNLLTNIFGNISLIKSMLDSDDYDVNECKERLLKIQSTAEKGADLIRHLMVFSHQRDLSPENINLNGLADEIKDLLQRTFGETIGIRIDIEDALWDIFVDESQLEHALINIGVNARDAMPDGGTLTIHAQNCILSPQHAASLGLIDGPYVHITVKDTGYGIPPDVIDNIFDPFFTTKDIGKGTGLGLSTVYGFVIDSKGSITAESDKNNGTSFHLYFPKSKHAQTVPLSKLELSQSIAQDSSKTILVVEDDHDIRMLSVQILKDLGYQILEAEDGHQALDIIKDNLNNIDLVFTDIAMPGEFNGVQMAARALSLNPDMKLLFTTGFADGSLPDMDLIKDYPVLNKPYMPDQLMHKINTILSQ